MVIADCCYKFTSSKCQFVYHTLPHLPPEMDVQQIRLCVLQDDFYIWALAWQSSVAVEFVAVVFDATRPNFFFSCAPHTSQFVMWGLGPRVVHWLCVSIIRPSVTFASLVWWPGCQMASTKKKLSRLQRLACLRITGAMRTSPTNAVEAHICLPPLKLVVQSEARSVVHCLWILGCWSYLHPNRGHSNILMWLQQLDPVFNMGVDTMRPAFNLESNIGLPC